MDNEITTEPSFGHAEAKVAYFNSSLEITDEPNAVRTSNYFVQPTAVVTPELQGMMQQMIEIKTQQYQR